jgi:DNA-binding transcriptional LysR family regulator
MYLFWLSTFKKVIDEGSYTRAAAGLFVSQSAVSQQVRQLEKLFGAKLIQMSGRRLELTEAGVQVYSFATSMENEYDATRHAIDELLGRARRHIVIVSSMTPPAGRDETLLDEASRGEHRDVHAQQRRDQRCAALRFRGRWHLYRR